MFLKRSLAVTSVGNAISGSTSRQLITQHLQNNFTGTYHNPSGVKLDPKHHTRHNISRNLCINARLLRAKAPAATILACECLSHNPCFSCEKRQIVPVEAQLFFWRLL